MARSHVRWQFGVWRKPGHKDTPKDARLLYVTILSDELLNQGGVVRVALDMWAEDAAMTDTEVRAALDELAARRFVVVDGHELLVRTYIRNDGVADQPNVLRNALACLQLLRSPVLRRVAADELRKLPPPLPPRELKNGRTFVYPDPHAAADELDPDGPEHDRGPVDNPVSNEPFGRVPGRVPGRDGGRGRGRGISSSPVGGSVGGSRARAREAPPAETPAETTIPGMLVAVPAGIPSTPPRCARCSKLPPEIDRPCRRCQGLREDWQRDRQQLDRQQVDERAARRAAIQACNRCDETGMHDTGHGLARCTHQETA